MNDKVKTESKDANRDPITGAPGAHPVGTGVGAAAAGAAAGAAIGSVAGPVGTAVGIVAGAVVGGLAGKGVAEKIDPTVEDAYWRQNYAQRRYVEKTESYDAYQPAYRLGYESRAKYPGKRYEEVEADLQGEYERSRAKNAVNWDKARYASRDAWERLDKRPASTGTTN